MGRLKSKLGFLFCLAVGASGCFSIVLIGEVRDKVVRLTCSVDSAPLGKVLSGSVVKASGGTGPYTFSVVSGPGTVDPSTGAITVNSSMAAPEFDTLVVRATDTIGERADISIEVFRPGVVDRSFGGGNGYVISTGRVATGGLARDPTTGRWLGTAFGGAELWDDNGAHLATLPNQVTGMSAVAGQRVYASPSGGSAAIGGYYVPAAPSKLYVQRYDFTGASLFGGSGYYTAGGGPGGPDRVYGLNVLSNGRTLVTGTFKNGGGLQGGFLLRLTTTGTVDPGYTGIMLYPATAPESYSWDGVVETQGGMYNVALGRYIDGDGHCVIFWARLDSAGGSQTGGMTDAPVDLCDSTNPGRVIAQQGLLNPAPNRVYYGFNKTGAFGRIMAFSVSTANVLTAFGGASGVTLGLGDFTTIDRIIVDQAGRVLACGRRTGAGNNFIVRYTTTGALDSTFGTNGGWIPYTPPTTGNDSCGELALDSTDSYLYVGFASSADTAFYRLRYGK